MEQLIANNRRWSQDSTTSDPQFFQRHAEHQHPEFLWIGCSDSRVPAEALLGLSPGHVFVQRNVGNQVLQHDMNVMSCLEYAVDELKVKAILVCGHYGCGAVKAALHDAPKHLPNVGAWISDICACRHVHQQELHDVGKVFAHPRLCELNVMRQVHNLLSCPIVQKAWARGQALDVYGLIYDLTEGLIKPVVGPLSSAADIQDATSFEQFSKKGRSYVAAADEGEDEATTEALGAAVADGLVRPGEHGVHSELTSESLRQRRAQEVARRRGGGGAAVVAAAPGAGAEGKAADGALDLAGMQSEIERMRDHSMEEARQSGDSREGSSGSDEEGVYMAELVGERRTADVYKTSSLYASA